MIYLTHRQKVKLPGIPFLFVPSMIQPSLKSLPGGIALAVRKPSEIIAVLLLILVAFIWGNAFVAISYAIRFIGPADLLAFRFLPASLLFLLLIGITRSWSLPFRMTPAERKRLVIAGLCSVPIYNFALNWGEQHITAGMAALIIALNPAITYLLGLAFFGEKFSLDKFIGILVAFIGLSVVIVGNQQIAGEGGLGILFLGALVTLVSPLAWAIYTWLGKPLVARYRSMEVTCWANLIGALPVLLLLRPSALATAATELPWTFWLAIGWLAVFCTVVGYLIWYYGLKRLGPTRVSSFIYLIPAFAIIFDRIILGRPITLSLITGGVLILAGISMVNWHS
jgi:drug/metabolite transporter (DMT)-like permease